MYLSLYCKGSKRVTQGFTVRGSWRLNKDCNILTPPAPPDTAVCRSRSPGMLNRGPGGLFSFQHLLTNWSPNSIGVPKAPSTRCCSLYCILSPTGLVSKLVSKLTDFQSSPSYIIVPSPTQSLEWHVWSSSSGNNCYAVHRSLSSGALGFYLVPYCQPSPPTRFLPITAIGMCHFRCLWNSMFGRVEGQYKTQNPFGYRSSIFITMILFFGFAL